MIITEELQDYDFINIGSEDSESDDEAYDLELVCAICDNGGELISCEGKCFRSFHATKESSGAQDTNCDSLCLSPEALKEYYICENCRYNLHQCFVCGELGSSDESSNTEVFQCSAATCGHFYHPKCVAKLLQKDNEAESQVLENKIAEGDSFICPAHKCAVCKQTENENVEDFQFAVCMRCPTSYHRKCLPRNIRFDDEGDNDAVTRAWNDLLPKSRALMYCKIHKMIRGLGTPARRLKVRNILHSKTDQPSETPKNKKKVDDLPINFQMKKMNLNKKKDDDDDLPINFQMKKMNLID